MNHTNHQDHEDKPEETQLDIQGMTCASCVRRVEKALAKVPGVESASVNFATNQATVVHDHDATTASLIKAVVDSGYGATTKDDDHKNHGSASEHAEHMQMESASELANAKNNLILSIALTIPLFLISMFWHARPEWVNWLLFALATPVTFWCGRQFFFVAGKALRHFTTTMDTLVAMGAGAAWAYSTYALISERGHGKKPNTTAYKPRS